MFDRTLDRVVEYGELAGASGQDFLGVTFCGQGEPLVHPRVVDCVRAVTARGLPCALTTNAALLDERRSTALLDAGLGTIWVTVADLEDTYADVYGLPFERMRDNLLRFGELAEGRCTVLLGLLEQADRDKVARVRDYWRARGFSAFVDTPYLNRGGSLHVDSMRYDAFDERVRAAEIIDSLDPTPGCAIPFAFCFVGFDGHYYLCSNDWEKSTSYGTVFEVSIADTLRAKAEHVQRRASPCSACSCDPTNRVCGLLHEGADEQAVTTEVDAIAAVWTRVGSLLDAVAPAPAVHRATHRQRIPVRAISPGR